MAASPPAANAVGQQAMVSPLYKALMEQSDEPAAAAAAETMSDPFTHTGNLLEDYLESILALPVELRRTLNLLRELDAKCAKDLSALAALQEAHIDARKRKMDEAPFMAKAEAARKRVETLLEEKGSVTMQLVEMTASNLARLKKDVRDLEGILRIAGDLESDSNGNALQAGQLAAVLVDEGESQWILAKVVEWLPNKRVVVCDAENEEEHHTVSINMVEPLVEDDDVASARTRFKTREVLAIYPETTVFYRATVSGNPFRAGVELGPLANRICVNVAFDDDYDEEGNIPKRLVLASNVVVRGGGGGG